MRFQCPLTRRTALGLAFGLLGPVLGCRDGTESPAGPTDGPAPAFSAAAALSFRQVSPGVDHTCGLTTDGRAYCWGVDMVGETFTHSSAPVAVPGGLTFRQVSTGTGHACGITPGNQAYCWGGNGTGQLGDGTRTQRARPTPVAGGRLFSQISAGSDHTCALSYPDRRAYCWGWNSRGQLGDFTRIDRLTPVAVRGGRQFRQLSAGSRHNCAVTPTNEAYCWGSANHGQIGDGSTVYARNQPKLVAGGHSFLQVEAGFVSSCGVTTGHRAFCWGHGTQGQLGDGASSIRNTPGPVAGGLSFDRVTVGENHACGETSNNRAYCWGDNSGGRLGDGTTTTRLRPRAVVGGLAFAQLTAGAFATCGTTTAGEGYCWGFNTFGQLGDGTTTTRLTPTPIVGPM